MRPPMIQGSFNCSHDIALWFTLACMLVPDFTLTMSLLNQHMQFWPRSNLVSYLINISAGCNFPLWKWSGKGHFKTIHLTQHMWSWCITADGLTLQWRLSLLSSGGGHDSWEEWAVLVVRSLPMLLDRRPN